MVKSNKVSIIMPAYNSGKFIAEAIDSVLNQTHDDWELLVIDDGSTDDTGEIIDSYAQKNSKITAFHTENLGVSHARNFGLDNATGEWVLFFDSDDLLPSDALANLLAASDGKDLVIGNYCEFPQGNLIENFEDACFVDKVNVLKKPCIWGMIFRRKEIQERFIYGLQFGEDTLFTYEFLTHCEYISTVHNVVYEYRRSELGSLSHQYQNLGLDFVEAICKVVGDVAGDNRELYRAYVAARFVTYTDTILNFMDLTMDEKRARIEEALKSKTFQDVPLINLKIKSDMMRRFVILKTNDMALIEKGFMHEQE